MDPTLDTTGEVCPVCFTQPKEEEGVRLQYCGHLYCAACLAMVTAAMWPLVCNVEDCGEQFVVEDFKHLDSETLQKLQRKALEHKLNNDTSLKPCPSPDCSGVFRKYVEKTDKTETEAFYCSFCGVHVCRRWVDCSLGIKVENI